LVSASKSTLSPTNGVTSAVRQPSNRVGLPMGTSYL
jgi:hypothetical protein